MNILHRYYSAAWLDRFNISPSQNWDKQLLVAHDQASHAIVVLSDNYLKTHYSRNEFEMLSARNIPIIAIVVDELTTELLTDIQPDYWIDCRSCHNEQTLKANINRILEHLPLPEERVKQSERTHYLHILIAQLEVDLSNLPTSRAASLSYSSNLQESHPTRQRGYDNNLLTQWHFTYQDEGSTLDIENIMLWFEAQSQFVLCGPSGNGKTVIAQLLALQAAHQALHDTTVALPIWLDLVLWTENQTFEAFIESQWPLAFYWKHWLDTNQAFVIFDNWSDFRLLNPERVDELYGWIETARDHKIIVLAQDEADIELDLPVLHLDSVPIDQIQRFTSVFLPEKQKDIFKRLVSNHASKVRFSYLDYISCGIELVAMNSEMAVDTWHINPATSLITLRWKQHQDEINATFSLDYFITTMQSLAWHMLQQEQYRFISYASAKQLLLDETPIQVALDLGLLSTVGKQLRFQMGILQWHLAAQHLAQDGIYKHLSHPKFLSDGQRQRSKWDNVVIALIDHVPDEQKQRIIDQIAEIDPYLAYACLQRYPDLYKAYLQPIITKLIEMRSKNPTSQTALTSVLRQIPYVEETAIILIQQLPKLDWSMQQWIWIDLLRLPLDIPTDFVSRVRRIDRHFPDSAFDLLSDSPSLQYLAYLAHMINYRVPKIQRNAIWLSGELKPETMKVGLFTLLENSSIEIRLAAFSALSNISNDAPLIKQMLIWLRNNLEHSGDVGDAINKMGRPVSGCLLSLTHDSRLPVDDGLRNAIIKYAEEDIALAVAQFIVAEPEMQANLKKIAGERENVMKVQKLLQSSMQQLPRNGLNRLIDDIYRVLGIQSDSNSSEPCVSETLYQRTQSAISSANKAEVLDKPLQDIPERLHSQLQSQDPHVRQGATESLVNYRAEQSIPLLLQSVKDPEVKVQIAALQGLAQLVHHEPAHHALISALSNQDHVIIGTATELLKSVSSLDSGELMDLLDTENMETLVAVIEIIGHARYEEAVPYLIPLLDDDVKSEMSDKTVGDYVAEALIAIGTSEALDAVNQSSYVQSPVQGTSIPSTSAQSATDNPTQAPNLLDKVIMLLNDLRSDDWDAAQKAARTLRDLVISQKGVDYNVLIEPLCEAMSDSNWQVRWAVVEALAWLQHPTSIPYVAEHLEDSSWIVQAAVIRTLAELQATQYALDISKHLDHENHVVRETAIEALGTLRNPEAIPQLDQMLQSDDSFLRLAAIQSIYQIGSDDIDDYLVKALQDSDVHIRWFAMKHFAPHAGSNDELDIARMLTDTGKPPWENTTISDYAVQALTAINTPKSKAILDKWSTMKERKNV